jgi:hypothetical protein
MSINNINDVDFQECANTYYNGFSVAQTQHSYFADNMIPVMVSVLNEIKNEIFITSQIFAVENPEPNSVVCGATNTIAATINYNVITPWNWDTYFTYISYVGLQGTVGFNTQFPPNSDALNKFKLYITYCISSLNNRTQL